jgi:hypothetical protein
MQARSACSDRRRPDRGGTTRPSVTRPCVRCARCALFVACAVPAPRARYPLKIGTVFADILLSAADIGPVALDITAVSGDVRLVARDIPLLVPARALLSIVMPQVGLVRTNIPTVTPHVTRENEHVRSLLEWARRDVRSLARCRS